MGKATTNTAFDSYVSSAAPNKNYSESTFLRVKSGAMLGYISFARPFKPRSSIVKAELVFHSAGAYAAASRTLVVKRQGNRAALYKNLTWANKPAAHGDSVSVTQTTALEGGAEWRVDVTAHCQLWSDGADFDGWEVSTTLAAELRFYSTDTTESWAKKLEPELQVWVADEPDAPQDLSPSGNRIVSEPKPVLRWSQLDINGDTNIVAAQVQVDNVVTFAAPDWDSGEQGIDQPSMNLQTVNVQGPNPPGPPFPGLPADSASRYWRVRVKDGAGLWSDYSKPVSVRYLLKGVPTMIAPAVASPTISDPTPPISWSLAGATQRAYRLEVFRKHATLNLWADAWDSGKITATTTTVTLPKGVLAYDDRRYRVRLTLWDTHDRQSTPTAPAAYIIEREFYFDKDAAVSPTQSISATQQGPYPLVDVRFTFAVLPDRAVVSRDGVIVADIEAADLEGLRQGDGSYVWVDRAPRPGDRNAWTVRPVSGGKMGWGNPTAYLTPRVRGRWLITKDTEVFLAGTEQDLNMVELAGELQPLGDGPPIRIITGLQGWSGTVSGKLVRTQDATALDAVAASTWRDRLMRIKRDQTPCTFIAGDISVPVSIKDVVSPPTALPRDERGELSYTFSFGLQERAAHDWEAYG